MEMKKTDFEYDFNFSNDQECQEFLAWCLDHKGTYKNFRITYYNTLKLQGSIEFDRDDYAMAFKLRWM